MPVVSMSETSQLGPSNDGTVMIDIGGDIGALVIMTDESLLLAEIEISPEDASDASHDHGHDHGHDHDHDHAHDHAHDHGHAPTRTHVAVRERRGPGGVRYAAIYPNLRQGSYTVYGLDGTPRDTVEIVGGEVRQLDWR